MPQTGMTRRFAGAAAVLSVIATKVASAQTAGEMKHDTTIFPVSFPTGSTVLHKADHETINGVAAMMKREPNLTATVLGKADTVGSADYNHHLSWKRAAAVYEALVFGYRIAEDRVEMRWTGEAMPTVKTADEAAMRQNRVVEIIVRR